MVDTPSFLKPAEAEHEIAVTQGIEALQGVYHRLCQFHDKLSKEFKNNPKINDSYVGRLNAETYRIKIDLDAILETHFERIEHLKNQSEKEDIQSRLKESPELLEAHLSYKKISEDSVKSSLMLIHIQQGLIDTLIQRVAIVKNVELYTLDEVLEKYRPSEPGHMFA